MSENQDNRANEVADPAEEKRTVIGGEGVEVDTENYTIDKNESAAGAGVTGDDSVDETQSVEPGTPVDEVHPNLPDPS